MSIYKKLIFVVDDDPMMCEMLADHLMKNPHNSVKTFATGEECLKCLDENPSAVILDINLSRNNENAASGMDILKRIKQMDQHIPVVMLSGQEHYGVAAQSILKGASDYVMKDDDAFEKLSAIVTSLN